MCGKNCVAIASDLRFGINQQQTTAVDMKKIYEIHPHLYVGLSGAFILIAPVPVRPRSRRELHSLRTFSPGVRSSPPTHTTVSSIPTRAPRCLATQTDARPNSRRRPEIESLRFARNLDRT